MSEYRVHCPSCGEVANFDAARNVVSCKRCNSQYHVEFLGGCPEQFKEE